MKSSFFALAFFTSIATASPIAYLSAIPRDAGIAAIAVDESAGNIKAYNLDGSFAGIIPIERRSGRTTKEHLAKRAGSCANLSVDEAKTIPGWNAIVQYAKDNWGDGKFNLVTNPEDFLDRPAQACIDGAPVAVEKKGDAVCNTQTAASEGQLVGTSGSVALDILTGFTNTATWTVTKSSSVGVSAKLGATFKIPEIVEIGGEITTSTEFTNTLSNAFSTSVTAQQRQTLTVEAADGETCHVNFKSTTCNVQGVGKIRTVATGWMWFNFEDRTQGHFKWAVNMDAVLPNIDDRSSFTKFTGSMQGQSSSEFNGVCE